MTVSLVGEVLAGMGEGGAAAVEAVGVMYMLTTGLMED